MDKQPLLSICIPTKNRADVLKKCVESIVTSRGFSNEVEIVVSDNASSDGTASLIKEYTNKFTNIKYYKNDCDLGGSRNMVLSLERGTGVFLKLNNDYSIFEDGALEYLIKIVKEYKEQKPVLFFHYDNRKIEKYILHDMNDLLLLEKWKGMSWMGCYGYWRDDFMGFEDPGRRRETLFQQIDWFIRSFKKKGRIICLNKKLTHRGKYLSQRGYNYIEVHTRNFLVQFEELIQQGLLNESTIEKVKREELMPAMISWAVKLKIANREQYTYDSYNSFKIIKREFGYYSWYKIVFIKSIVRAIYLNIRSAYIKPIVLKILPFLKH